MWCESVRDEVWETRTMLFRRVGQKTLEHEICLVLVLVMSCVTVVGCNKRKASQDVPVVATIYWLDVSGEKVKYPRLGLSGSLFSSTAERGDFFTMATHREIEGQEYFGMQVVTGRLDKGNSATAGPPLFELFVRSEKTEHQSLNIRLNTRMSCKLVMDKFNGNLIKHLQDRTEMMKRPYIFEAGEYILEAVE